MSILAESAAPADLFLDVRAMIPATSPRIEDKSPATSATVAEVRRPSPAPAKPYRLLARKPTIRRPGLKTLVDDRFRAHPRDASVYLATDDAGYDVKVAWLGEDLAYRLRDQETGEVATVTDNAYACSCPSFRRLPRKACRHMLAVRSAFERVAELAPGPLYSEPEDWEDDVRWTVTDPDLDLAEVEDDEPLPTADDSYAPTELESLEWTAFTLAREGEHANPARDVELMPALRAFMRGRFEGEVALEAELATVGPRETDGYPAGYCS